MPALRIPLPWRDARIVAETRRVIAEARQLLADTDHLIQSPYRKPGEMNSALRRRERGKAECTSPTSASD